VDGEPAYFIETGWIDLLSRLPEHPLHQAKHKDLNIFWNIHDFYVSFLGLRASLYMEPDRMRNIIK